VSGGDEMNYSTPVLVFDASQLNRRKVQAK
jgi:hypothetical protein